MTDPRGQPCRTCRLWDKSTYRPPTRHAPKARALCRWGAAWLHGDRMRYEDQTGCDVHEVEAMPHG